MKLENVINVYLNDGVGTPVTHVNCSFEIDNCDNSIRIERKSETVAHYDFDEYLSITQNVSKA